MQGRRPPGRPRKAEAAYRPMADVVVYQVGRHEVQVVRNDRGWSATVNGVPVPGRFENQADAWAAAVGEADRLYGPGLGASSAA